MQQRLTYRIHRAGLGFRIRNGSLSSELIEEVLTSGPCAVTLAKELTLGFDRWTGTDEELRLYTLDFTSRMRGSKEGQEGLSSFLDKRDADWKS